METKKLTKQEIAQAAAAIQAGELVAFPTETVYGLGADALNEAAVKKVYQVKGRPSDNPLIVHVNNVEMVKKYVATLPEVATKLVSAFWPGPLTLIFNVPSDTFSKTVTGGLETVAFRMPDNQATLALIEQANVPLVGPSANTSGKPSPTSAEHVYHDLQGKIAAILDDGPTQIGVESTVLDLTAEDGVPVILRPGAITKEQLESIIPQVKIDTHLISETAAPKAPGMKYKHYSPDAEVWIINGQTAEWQAAIQQAKEQQEKIGLFLSDEQAAQLDTENAFVYSYGAETVENATKELFAGLRALDEQGATTIFAQGFAETGLGTAYMNRLKKSANQKFFEK